MKTNRVFIFIAALVAILAGLQMSRKGCPACLLLPPLPAADPSPSIIDQPSIPRP